MPMHTAYVRTDDSFFLTCGTDVLSSHRVDDGGLAHVRVTDKTHGNLLLIAVTRKYICTYIYITIYIYIYMYIYVYICIYVYC
jgi:hypothetical protein